MNSSRTAHRTRSSRQAFTLVELTVASALIAAVGLTALGVLKSSTVLSSQNAGINISSSRAREVIDQINDRARYALAQPDLINNDGTATTATTSDAIVVKKFLGGPYVVKEAGGTTADIPSTATSFCLEYRAGLQDPMVGDFVLMESVSRPELEIATVSAMTASGSVLRKLITTTVAIGEAVRPQYYRIGGSLYRKEAYVFKATDATSSPRFELRHFSRVQGSTNFSAVGTSTQMADGFRRFQNLPFFTNSNTASGAAMITLRALANSSNRQEYVARGSTVSTFTTVPLQVRLWSLNR